jgi:hypothetical protein
MLANRQATGVSRLQKFPITPKISPPTLGSRDDDYSAITGDVSHVAR